MQNSDRYDINLMCECLNVSRAGFYRFFYAGNSGRKERKASICMRIVSIHASDPLLGAPRITLLLHGEGIQIAQSTVSLYMKELGIAAATTQKRFRPKRSKLPAASSPAIVNRAKNVLISSPDAVWTTDITYIRTKAGWAYLSTIIDQFSRRVIAMRMSYSMASRLCCDTLEDALRERSYPVGVIIHSDKGSQYRSSAFVNLAEKRSVIQSFTSIGHSCDENAAQESFHSTLKRECVRGMVFEDLEHAQRVIFRWIGGYYNNSRPHTALGGLTPVAFESTIIGDF